MQTMWNIVLVVISCAMILPVLIFCFNSVGYLASYNDIPLSETIEKYMQSFHNTFFEGAIDTLGVTMDSYNQDGLMAGIQTFIDNSVELIPDPITNVVETIARNTSPLTMIASGIEKLVSLVKDLLPG